MLCFYGIPAVIVICRTFQRSTLIYLMRKTGWAILDKKVESSVSHVTGIFNFCTAQWSKLSTVHKTHTTNLLFILGFIPQHFKMQHFTNHPETIEHPPTVLAKIFLFLPESQLLIKELVPKKRKITHLSFQIHKTFVNLKNAHDDILMKPDFHPSPKTFVLQKVHNEIVNCSILVRCLSAEFSFVFQSWVTNWFWTTREWVLLDDVSL